VRADRGYAFAISPIASLACDGDDLSMPKAEHLEAHDDRSYAHANTPQPRIKKHPVAGDRVFSISL
jgi:hypothetical protein